MSEETTQKKTEKLNRYVDGVKFAFIKAGTFTDEDGNEKEYHSSIKISNGRDRDKEGKILAVRVTALSIKGLIKLMKNDQDVGEFVANLLQEERDRKIAEYED